MFSKKEILIGIVALIIGVTLAWSCRLEAKENKELYPNFLLYNSTQSCMQGLVSLMIRFNPELAKYPVPPVIQQQMLGHCSCVMDRIRANVSISDYYRQMNDFLWLRNTWTKYGTECSLDGYLDGLGIVPGENLEEIKVEDNKTIESPEQDSEEEEPLNGDETPFQG
tara:strand:- start:2036 stop:2536 length:501 start_codon:yes stop_codon:yes gene_type:complete